MITENNAINEGLREEAKAVLGLATKTKRKGQLHEDGIETINTRLPATTT